MNNWLGLLIFLLCAFGLIGIAELLRRWRGYGSEFTRKVIHIGVGMMSWFLHLLFDIPWFFIAACAGFMILNFLDWRYRFFPSMASADRSNLGTVYFPLVAGAVAFLLWDRRPLMVAALMPLTWGDGLAPVVGRAYGRRSYRVYGHVRTLEGSAAFFAAAFLFTWLAIWAVPGSPDVTKAGAILPALSVSVVTTFVEAISIWGVDNITITAAATLLLSAWRF